jgi:hypothetical protein
LGVAGSTELRINSLCDEATRELHRKALVSHVASSYVCVCVCVWGGGGVQWCVFM